MRTSGNRCFLPPLPERGGRKGRGIMVASDIHPCLATVRIMLYPGIMAQAGNDGKLILVRSLRQILDAMSESQFRWGVIWRMPLACMMCSVMSGSGWRTVIATVITVPHRTAVLGSAETANIADCVAVPMTIIRGICVQRIASGADRSTAATATVSVSPGRSLYEYLQNKIKIYLESSKWITI